jgi:hypothetical protein
MHARYEVPFNLVLTLEMGCPHPPDVRPVAWQTLKIDAQAQPSRSLSDNGKIREQNSQSTLMKPS